MLLEINSELVGVCALLFIMFTCLSYVIALEKAHMKRKERKGLIFIVLMVATTCMIVLEASANNFHELSFGDQLVIVITYFLSEIIMEYGKKIWFRYFLTKKKTEAEWL